MAISALPKYELLVFAKNLAVEYAFDQNDIQAALTYLWNKRRQNPDGSEAPLYTDIQIRHLLLAAVELARAYWRTIPVKSAAETLDSIMRVAPL